MKKKWIVIILAMSLTFVMLGALSACAGEQGPQGEKGEQGIQGIQGEAGKDGITPTIEISEDGYWVINGIKSEYKAVGQDGTDGNDGITPAITISTDGYWVINGIKSEYKAVGKDGINGNDGNDGRGIASVEYDKDGNLVITYTDNTSDTVVLLEREEHVHTYGEWIRYSEEKTSCEKVFYYQVCETCNAVEWRIGSKEDHVWAETYEYSATHHYISCEKCGERVSDFERHTLDDKGNCTVCKHFIGGLHYELSADEKSAIVTGYDGISQLVIIPEEYQGVPVTAIGKDAFVANSTIYSVYLPDTIIEIQEYAFCNSSLEIIELSENLKTIGRFAFSECVDLGALEIPKTVESIGEFAFSGTENLHLIVDNDNQFFKVIGNDLYSKDGSVMYWYNDCDKTRTSFVIPNTVKTIKESAFSSCRWLKQLTISRSVEKIEAFTFYTLPDLPSKVIFFFFSGWTCTRPKGDIYQPTTEELEQSGAKVLFEYDTYLWERAETV